MKTLDRIPGRIVKQDFRSTWSRHDVIPKVQLSLAQSSSFYRKILHINNDSVPTAGFSVADFLELRDFVELGNRSSAYTSHAGAIEMVYGK